MDNILISGFLKYGYFLDYSKNEYEINLSNIDKKKYLNIEEEDLISIAITKFKKAIEDNYVANQINVVPLSGGLDSRAILAGLLEFTEASNIYTYTFGTPGTLDYDIGNYVSKKLGTKHIAFPLNDYSYSIDELIEISNRIRNQTMLFHHPPMRIVDEYFKNHIIWSGFVGDVIAGGHLKNNSSESLREAKLNYLNKNTYVKSIDTTPYPLETYINYIEFEEIDREDLSFDEQVFFNERVRKLTAPHVLMRGYQYKTPFINNDFMDFMLSIDNKYRINEKLFIKMLLKEYPRIFKLKTKTSYGLPLNSSKFLQQTGRVYNKVKKITSKRFRSIKDPYINYLDFEHEFRENKNLNEIVYNSIQDLKSRNIIDWINIDSILNKHINRQGNYADALILLTSLEIHLKAKEL